MPKFSKHNSKENGIFKVQFHNKNLALKTQKWATKIDIRPVITNNPRALGQGLYGVWRLYHFPVVRNPGEGRVQKNIYL